MSQQPAATPRADRGSSVVVGVDGSPASRAALEFALREGVRRGSAVEVVTAWAFEGPYEGWLGPSTLAEARAAAERTQDTVVTAALDGADSPSVLSRRLVQAAAGPALVEAVRDADYLVVGTAHKNMARRALLGSVSHYCVQHSPRPVVVVPAHVPHATAAGVGTPEVAAGVASEVVDR